MKRYSAHPREALAFFFFAVVFVSAFIWLEVANVYEEGRLAERRGVADALEPISPYWHWVFTLVGTALFGAAALSSLLAMRYLIIVEGGVLRLRTAFRVRVFQVTEISGVSVERQSSGERLVVHLSIGARAKSIRLTPREASWDDVAHALNDARAQASP